MPATSEKQRRLFAIAEHHPEQLYARNRRLAKLSQRTLHDFAATKGSAMPRRSGSSRRLSDYAGI